MHTIPSILYVFLLCGATHCHYRNAVFHFTADIPNAQDATVCRPLDDEGMAGYRYIFGKHANCEKEDFPSVGVYVEVNTFYLPSAKAAAEQVCDKGTASASKLRIDGFPVEECLTVDNFKDGWVDDEYLVVSHNRNKEDGLIMTVVLSAPKQGLSNYRDVLLKVMQGVELDPYWQR